MSTNKTITPKTLKKILLDFLNPQNHKDPKTRHSIFVWGSMGIGKSEIIQQVNDYYGGLLIDLRLSQYDPTDIRGFPIYDRDTRQMRWAPSSELPTILQGDKYPIITLLLDELNSANPTVLTACYQLILNHRIGEYVLPPNTRIIAAGNADGDRGVTFAMPIPLCNRMLHYTLQFSFDDWIQHATETDYDPYILGFTNWDKESVNGYSPNSEANAFQTPRTWSFVNDYAKRFRNREIDEELFYLYVAGAIGEPHQIKFQAFIENQANLPSTEAILTGQVSKFDSEKIGMSGVYATVVNCNVQLKRIQTWCQQNVTTGNKFENLTIAFGNYFKFLHTFVEPELVVFALTNLYAVSNVYNANLSALPAELYSVFKDKYSPYLFDKN